ncbi:hypothetical protein ABK040_011148 [Willaertia magna]
MIGQQKKPHTVYKVPLFDLNKVDTDSDDDSSDEEEQVVVATTNNNNTNHSDNHPTDNNNNIIITPQQIKESLPSQIIKDTWGVLLLKSTQYSDLPSIFYLKDNIITIGRLIDNNVRLCSNQNSSKFISRKHCFIYKRIVPNNLNKYFIEIEDNKSLNGTLVNGKRINKQELQNGDLIMITGGNNLKVNEIITINSNGTSIKKENKNDKEWKLLLIENLKNAFIYEYQNIDYYLKFNLNIDDKIIKAFLLQNTLQNKDNIFGNELNTPIIINVNTDNNSSNNNTTVVTDNKTKNKTKKVNSPMVVQQQQPIVENDKNTIINNNANKKIKLQSSDKISNSSNNSNKNEVKEENKRLKDKTTTSPISSESEISNMSSINNPYGTFTPAINFSLKPTISSGGGIFAPPPPVNDTTVVVAPPPLSQITTMTNISTDTMSNKTAMITPVKEELSQQHDEMLLSVDGIVGGEERKVLKEQQDETVLQELNKIEENEDENSKLKRKYQDFNECDNGYNNNGQFICNSVLQIPTTTMNDNNIYNEKIINQLKLELDLIKQELKMKEMKEEQYLKKIEIYETNKLKLEETIRLQNSEMEERKNLIRNEMKCGICLNIYMEPVTLQCGHTFCKKCLYDWLIKNQSCPYCRGKPLKGSFQNKCLDHLLQLELKQLYKDEPDYLFQRDKRFKELKIKEDEDLAKFYNMIENAKLKNVKFLNILDRWKLEEKKTFKNGLKNYYGRCRGVFCELVGLSPQFIKTCPLPQLIIACENLDIPPATTILGTDQKSLQKITDIEGTRDRLYDFITSNDNLFFYN